MNEALTPSNPPEVAIVGAGPAGLMAAEVLALSRRAVTVYDRMPSPARKLLMAGRGGLNLTHSEDLPRFLARYGTGAPHLEAAIRALAPDALRAWCEGLGQETFIGSSGRVFPRTFKASPLLRAWLGQLEALGVRLAPRRRFLGWAEDGALRFDSPRGEERARPAATILALGGASWPRLGSDGAWTAILESQGVPVAPLRPANAGFRVAWSEIFRSRFEGEPLKRIALSFAGERVRGEAMVTATGIDGGAVYALSASLREAIAANGQALLEVDLRPDLALDALTRRLAAPRGGQSASTWLRKAAGLSPAAAGLLREAAGPALPREPEALARAVKAAPLTLVGIMPIERAISTAGGIRFDGLDGRFMLRRMPGTFAAGEMLDWEAPTGGYLLQACFATGAAAAQGALAWLADEEAHAALTGPRPEPTRDAR